MESAAQSTASVFQLDTRRRTKVQLHGTHSRDSCGYCKTGPSASYGITALHLNADDYEKMMYRGFRRSGNYIYKPTMHETCCPQYPIRLKVDSFTPSRSHKKLLRKVNALTSSSPIEVKTVRAECTPERFELYKKYQVAVHHDKPEEVSEGGFKRFLVDSPIPYVNGYGTHHQLYYLNNTLIAVGVLDFIPSGLSSVYCFYDPDRPDLCLGKFTALCEIEYCRNHNFPYYYMGFYIHSCPKMNYKGDYKPSELLCPMTYTWHFLSDVREYLDRNAFTPLEHAAAERRLDATSSDLSAYLPPQEEIDLSTLPLDIGAGDIVSLSDITPRGQAIITPILHDWSQLVGKELAPNIEINFGR